MIKIISIIILIFITSNSVFAIQPTQEECETGNGIWHQVEEKGYCSCENGLDWNNEEKQCIDNRKIKCESTNGIWTDNTCICEEDSTGYDPRFGCTYNQLKKPFGQPEDSQNNYNSYWSKIIISIFVISIIGLLIRRFS